MGDVRKFSAWSFLRNVLLQGRDIHLDHADKDYESFSARVDEAAREREQELERFLAARGAVAQVGKLAPVAFAGSDGKPAWIHDGNGVGLSTAVPFKTVLYALSLPDGVLVRNGPLGVLATEDEAQAMRLAHVRDADGPPTIVRYLYAGTWRDWNNAGRQTSAESAAAPQPAGEAVPSALEDGEALAREVSDFKPEDGCTRDDVVVMSPENLREFARRLVERS